VKWFHRHPQKAWGVNAATFLLIKNIFGQLLRITLKPKSSKNFEIPLELEHLIQEVQEICLLLKKTTSWKHAVWYEDRCTVLGSGNLRPKEIERTVLEIK